MRARVLAVVNATPAEEAEVEGYGRLRWVAIGELAALEAMLEGGVAVP
jgi:hypothetical protein